MPFQGASGFFVIQFLIDVKKKALNGLIVGMVIQKNRQTAGSLRKKGNVIAANFHKFNVKASLAKWKEYHFLNIDAFFMEIIPLKNHAYGTYLSSYFIKS